MKIGIDIRIYGTGHGGIGRYCRELLPGILEQGPKHNFVLFYNRKAISDQDLAALKNLAAKFNAVLAETDIRHYSFKEQTSFLKLLNSLNLDLMHFTNFNVPYFYKKPFVATIHDVVHHKIGGAKKSHWVHFQAYKKIIERAARDARAIITVSHYSRKDISTVLRVSPEKVRVIYEGASLSPDVSEPMIKEVKKRYLISRPYFLFVGVLERKKNIINLARGFDRFVQKYRAETDLVIAGKADPHYPDIKHKALDIKNKDRLVFTGYVEDDELEALYAGAYSFVSASLHEGFGLPGVEALRYGLPLMVSNIEVFNEIYDNAAIYFDPLNTEDIAEKFHLLTRDREFHHQMQEKSLNRSLLYDWGKAAAETLKVYESVSI